MDKDKTDSIQIFYHNKSYNILFPMVIINKSLLGHPVFRIKDVFDLENGITEVIFNTYSFIKSPTLVGFFVCGMLGRFEDE